MNMRMIIKEINRKRIPFCDIKKRLFIDDDMKLINTLLEVIEIGINSLNYSIVRSNFMYIIYSMQYLKILSEKYPEINIKIESSINKWNEKIETIVQNKKIKKNTEYNLFIQDILEQMKHILPEQQEINIQPLSFKSVIKKIIKNADDIDIEKLKQSLHINIEKYLSMDKDQEPWNEVNRIVNSLQDKLINAKNQNEEIVISEIILILGEYYNEYRKTLMNKHKESFQSYISTNYKEEVNHFNHWNIRKTIEKNQPFVITIDEPYSLDLDDALAVTQDEYGMTLHVYIANTNPFLINNPTYESVAFERHSSLYFHRNNNQKVYHMLPTDCAENILSLKENEVRNVVEHKFYLDYFGNISYNVSYKNIAVNKRLSYAEVDEIIEKQSIPEISEYLCSLENCINIICRKLKLNREYTFTDGSRAQKIVSSASILVNSMTATEAIKNQYLLLYQDYYSGKYSVNVPENAYVKVTSPIRRYSDLKNNYLFSRFLEGNVSEIEYYNIEKELQDMLSGLEERKERNKQFSKVGSLHFNNKI